MCTITKTQTYGPNEEYFRIAIPKEFSDFLEVEKGSTWIWELDGDHCVSLRLIK